MESKVGRMSLFGRPSLGGRNVQAKAAPGAGKEVYCFPILQPQEIIEVLRDMGAKPGEIEKADKERITSLEALYKNAAAKSAEKAHWAVMLASAHKEGGSRNEAKRLLQEVVAMGPSAGEPTLGTAKDLVKGM